MGVVSNKGRGHGGENETFIIVDSLKAKVGLCMFPKQLVPCIIAIYVYIQIQTSSKTSFYMEMYSHCFEGIYTYIHCTYNLKG